MSIFEPFYTAIAKVILGIHAVLSPVFGYDSGAAWALSIVLLTVLLRVLLFPLFVKQIRAQRRMMVLQPKMAELRKKHQGDRETLNRETMALYREHNANPFASCLPLILQIPIFFALFRVLEHLAPDAKGHFHAGYGFTVSQAKSGAQAQIFGAPIAASFSHPFNGDSTSIKVICIIFIILMGATTFITQRQMLARASSTATDDTQLKLQRGLMYIFPLGFAFSGTRFPLGVLMYWVTSNAWSMGQQFFVIRRMPPVVPAGGAIAGTGKPGTPGTTGKPGKPGKPDTPSGPSGPRPVKPPRGPKPAAGPAAATPSTTTGPVTPAGQRRNVPRAKRKKQQGRPAAAARDTGAPAPGRRGTP